MNWVEAFTVAVSAIAAVLVIGFISGAISINIGQADTVRRKPAGPDSELLDEVASWLPLDGDEGDIRGRFEAWRARLTEPHDLDVAVEAAASAIRSKRNPYITPVEEGTDYDRSLAEAAVLPHLCGQGVPDTNPAPLDAMYDRFAAMNNQDIALEEYPQAAVDALARAGWAVVPCALPYEVLGEAAQARVFETGNPMHGWDYLLARVRLYPAAPKPAEGGEDGR